MPDTKIQDLTTSMPEPGAFFPFVHPDGLATDNATPELLGGAYCGPNAFMTNGVITVTVVSNNLTVAIKTIAGADPSATDPVKFRIGNVYRLITSAISVTKNAATNWCNAGATETAAKEIDYFVYLGYNATDGVTIGFSRIPNANIYSDFSATTTNEKYCAISTITNAAAGDNYVNIGRFAATLSAGAGYTWSVPTFTAVNLIQKPIFETRYLTWIPTISSSGGTHTTVVATGGFYKLDNDNLIVLPNIAVTNKGTATGYLFATLPYTPAAATGTAGRESGTTGKTLSIGVSAINKRLDISLYDGTTMWVDGYTAVGNLFFKAA